MYFASLPSAEIVTIGKYMELILVHTLLYCFCEITCYSGINDNCLVPILCIYISDFYFIRLSLGIRHWRFGWWMLKCIPTWVFWPHLLPLSIVEYSFIRWFDSLLTHSVERGISISWVSMKWTYIQSVFKMLANIIYDTSHVGYCAVAVQI